MTDLTDKNILPLVDKLNGTPLPPPAEILPEHRQKQVEAGLSAYQMVCTERDHLRRLQLDAAADADSLRNQLNSMRGVIDLMEASYKKSLDMFEERCIMLQIDRDKMADRAVSLETTLANLFSQLRDVVVGRKDANSA